MSKPPVLFICLLLVGSLFGQDKPKPIPCAGASTCIEKTKAAPTKPLAADVKTSPPSVSLACNASTNATGYNFYRLTITPPNSCPTTMSSYTRLGTSPMSSTCGYTDPTVAIGGTYCYAATAVDASGESGISTPVQAAIAGFPTVAAVSPVTGSAGTAITITGTGFLTGATVTVGGTAATSIVVVNATQITAVTPAGSGVAAIVVTNTNTLSGTLASGFTYATAPSPPTGLVVVSITASNVLLQWQAPAGITVVSYNVYRCGASACSSPPLTATVKGTPPATSFTDVCNHKKCWYTVKATVLVAGKSVLTTRSNIVYAPI